MEHLPQLVVWGSSGHARVLADIIRLRKEYSIAGFLDDVNAVRHGTPFMGSNILGGRECLDQLLRRGINRMVVGIGDCRTRMKLAGVAIDNGFTLISVIHPAAVIAADATIGPGAAIMAGSVVGTMTTLGSNTIINTCASIDHDCRIGDGVHLAPGVHLGGNVTVGSGTWLGIGAVVKDGVTIGAASVIGAGSVVLHDLPDRIMAWGAPAEAVKENPDDQR